MKQEKHANGETVYTIPTVFSLLIFYALSMQCMSTLAIVKRETGTWKWPMVQLVYMTGLAWISAWITYVLLK
jgi:ferrous iron transport protein B